MFSLMINKVPQYHKYFSKYVPPKNKIPILSKYIDVKITKSKVTYLGFERYMTDPSANMHATCLKIFAGQQSIAI